MTIKEATKNLSSQLLKIYTSSESLAIAKMVMAHIVDSQQKDGFRNQQLTLGMDQESRLKEFSQALLENRPVQYVLNESWFFDLKLYVDENVLIPRPETEELVEWTISEAKKMRSDINIVDIGTGSGCIALAIKKKLPRARLSGFDISKKALDIARRNAGALGIDISIQQVDFLDQNQWSHLPIFDIIVSNPPYVPESDRSSMAKHVVDHEPALALFAPNNDPLVFYRAIADFGKEQLSKEGMIFMEIHENLGKRVIELFHSSSYKTELRRDMQGKERMIMARR